MIRKKLYVLCVISLSIIKNCTSNHNYFYNDPKYLNHDMSVHLPKWNIKIAAAIENTPDQFYHQEESFYNSPQDIGQFTDINTWNNNYMLENQPIYESNIPTYYIDFHNLAEYYPQSNNLPEYNFQSNNLPVYKPQLDNLSAFDPNLYYPIITREPVSIKRPCIQKIFFKTVLYPNASNSEENESQEAAKLHKHNTESWFFVPNSNGDNNQNILREADPRASFVSHSHFIKINKPGKKTIFHNTHIIKDHTPHHKFIGPKTIHKNTHIHVHNRNSQQEDTKINEQIIGSHLFGTPRWRSSRSKRNIIDFVKLATDHRTKIDTKRTAENIGAATRNLFEKEYSPGYHLRNALSSTQDSLYSLMNVRPSGILIPCRYKIVDGNNIQNIVSSPIVGDINPNIYKINEPPPAPLPEDGTDELNIPTEFSDHAPNLPEHHIPELPEHHTSELPEDHYEQYYDYNADPLHQIGSKLRDSVQWMHKSAEHAVDALYHVRQMLSTTRKNWPRLLLPYAGALEVNKPKFGQQNEPIVGSPKDPEFIGIGRMMDYLGITDQKYEIPPQVGSPRIISEEEMILRKAKDVLGAPNYRAFLDEIRKQINIHQPASDTVSIPRRIIDPNIQARLALNRIRTSIKLQKAKADLKRLQTPKLPVAKIPTIPKPPSTLLHTLNKPKPALTGPKLLKEPLKPPLKPSIKESVINLKNPLIPAKSSPESINKSLLKLPKLKEIQTKPRKSEETENSNSSLEKIRIALENYRKLKQQNEIIQMTTTATTSTTSKPIILKPLEKLRMKLFQKYNIPKDDTDHSDILGRTLTHIKNKEEVGAPRSAGNVEPIPSPVFTKEMKTPFMGLATKEDIEQYFKKLYCPDCKIENSK